MSLIYQLPSSDLFQRVMARIVREERLHDVRRRFMLFSILLVGSLATAIPAIQWLRTELAVSGFTAFISLALSDGRELVGNWQSFGTALLESLPVASLALTLFVIFIFLQSLKILIRDFKGLALTS
ncbi:MAG: hypothetical protein V1707_02615 [bacterium]